MTNEKRNAEMLKTGIDPVKAEKDRRLAEFYREWKAEKEAQNPEALPDPLGRCAPVDTHDVLPEQDYRLLGATSMADLYNGVTLRRAVKARNDDYPNN